MEKRGNQRLGPAARILYALILLLAIALVGLSIYMLSDRPSPPARGSGTMPGQAAEGSSRTLTATH